MITKVEAEKAYADLIQLRRSEVLVKDKANLGQIEFHHILPHCCGGSDDQSNIVALYAKEHFMAHVYLWIIHHDDEFHYKMVYALNQMIKGTVNGSRTELRDFILQSEEYQKAKEEFALQCSKTMTSRMKNPNKNYSVGKIWICNEVYKLSFLVSEALFWMYLGEGWRKGRVIDWNKYVSPEQKAQNEHLIKKIKHVEKLSKLCQMFEEFKLHGFNGVVKKFGYTHTRNNLITDFKSHIPEYVPAKCNRWKNRTLKGSQLQLLG